LKPGTYWEGSQIARYRNQTKVPVAGRVMGADSSLAFVPREAEGAKRPILGRGVFVLRLAEVRK